MTTEKKYSRKHLDSPDINLTYFLMLWKSLPVVSNFTTFYKFYMYNWIVTKNYDKSFVFLSSVQYHIYRRLNGGWTTSWAPVNWRYKYIEWLWIRRRVQQSGCSPKLPIPAAQNWWVLTSTRSLCWTHCGILLY